MTRQIVLFLSMAIAVPVGLQATTVDKAAIVHLLNSSQWTDRASGFSQLAKHLELLNDGEMQTALIDAEEKENAIHLEANRRDLGSAEVLGEDYAEYAASLSDMVQAVYSKSHNPRALHALVWGAYDPESRTAQMLAAHGDEVIGEIEKMSLDSSYFVREEAVGVAGLILRDGITGSSKPTAITQQRANNLLYQGAQDVNDQIRIATIRALIASGDKTKLSLINSITVNSRSEATRGALQAEKAKAAIQLSRYSSK